MGLFGSLFGRRQPPATPPGNAPWFVGGGMPGLPDNLPPARREGIGTGWMIAGSIGDAMQRLGGGQGTFAPQLQMMQRQQMEERQRVRALQDHAEEWTRQQEYGQAHPAPRAPHHWRANNGDLMEVGPDGQPRRIYHDPTPRVQWQRVTDPRTGAITIVPIGLTGGAEQGSDDEWDYGDGGPSPQSSGGFPGTGGPGF